MKHDILGRRTIGSAEPVDFVAYDLVAVPARIDTGARTSAVWASSVRLDRGVLRVVLFDKGSRYYTGEVLTFDHFKEVIVSTSTGDTEPRFKVQLVIRLSGRRIRGFFTLADRSQQVYPVLIGRNILRGKFIVDVNKAFNKELRIERHQREVAREKFNVARHEENI